MSEAEAKEVKDKLGIGATLDKRIAKVTSNGFQYASVGDTKSFVSEITRLRSDLEKAREALRPLARFANVIDESEKTCGGEPSPDERAIHGELTVGHFRRAALTLKEIDNERT